MARGIFRRLKFDRDTMDKVCNLIKYHDYRFSATARNVRRAMNMVGVDAFPNFLEVRYADTMAQSDYQRQEKLQQIEDISAIYEEIKARKECVTLGDLAVNGRDLISQGVTPGKKIGDVLGKMLMDVIDDPEHNTKEYLLEPERLSNFLKDQ